jgi:hypothetical protein
MKSITNIKHSLIAISVISLLQLSSCKVDNIVNPNNPSLEGVLKNATIDDLNNVVVGTESSLRNGLGSYYDNTGVIGREIYRFSGSDPRFTSDLLGAGNAVLDNNTFYTTTFWASSYRSIKNTNILIESANNTSLITEQQKQGYLGFANTIKAYSLLLILNLTDDNGIRVDVADPNNLGPIVSKTEALTAIAALLETASTQLGNAGSKFAFKLSTGFEGFDSPSTFKTFNRALAARVALYRGNYPAALTFLTTSFYNLNGSANLGVYYVFSSSSGDQLNPLFLPLNATGEVRVAQPKFLSDAESGDNRLNKITLRTSAAAQSGLTGTHDFAIFSTNTSSISIIRNEELILIYAEANIKIGANGYTNAVNALNNIRLRHQLGAYAGLLTDAALTNEMLKQRRYSLYMEGHRWIDMRRYNRLDQLPIDRVGDDVWSKFPIPFPENVK